jgi:ankyrin repeat protein
VQEERAKRARVGKVRAELLEAAFDGDVDVMHSLFLEDVADVEMADPHGNTLLSEAAAGGHLEGVLFLIAKGANPNTQGEFKRTPLWRACFLGHVDVVQPLLEAGADPRILNEQVGTDVTH